MAENVVRSNWRTWLGASLILFAISERAFWVFWRQGDAPGELFITWLAYALVAAFALSLARLARAKTFDQVFLIGALAGWPAEGVVVQTALGSPDNPFPLSLSWTGLAWHSWISVVGGWWLLPRLARTGLDGKAAALLAGTGLLWSGWAAYYVLEPGLAIVSIESLLSHTLFVAAMLFGGLLIMPPPFPAPAAAKGDRWTAAILGVVAAALFCLVAVPANPAAALALAACFGASVWALFRLSHGAEREAPAPGSLSLRNAGLIMAVLLGASVPVAVLAVATGTGFWGNILVYIISMPIGFWLWARAIIRAFRHGHPPSDPHRDAVSLA